MGRVKTFDELETLERAIELFWLQGYDATSIQDLVEALGINRASLYATYGGKRALFFRSFRHYQEKNQSILSAFLDEQDDVRLGLRNLFERSMGCSSTGGGKGCFAVNNTVALKKEDEEMTKMLKENRKIVEETFRNFLQKGVNTEQISQDKDLNALAGLLVTFYYGLQALSRISEKTENQFRAVDALIAAL